ncbi:hypothetical protein C0Q70_02382 [Pomacea canaliculata]|uniref:Uncharacterized protein n=1 Tax=Pomacea canaliculata TaxID=400727 RepID=A0A2T7PPU2_POMCA|nr:hypothetical protein C0Q70_02382 [Pomacea canaliculata]
MQPVLLDSCWDQVWRVLPLEVTSGVRPLTVTYGGRMSRLQFMFWPQMAAAGSPPFSRSPHPTCQAHELPFLPLPARGVERRSNVGAELLEATGTLLAVGPQLRCVFHRKLLSPLVCVAGSRHHRSLGGKQGEEEEDWQRARRQCGGYSRPS